jgi:chaperone modulatory protein CbpM
MTVMNATLSAALRGRVVEEEVELTLVELGHACDASEDQIEHWVFEGVLEPIGQSRAEWRFAGSSLARVRLATRLSRDLELNASGVALAIDLLERIASLESRLGR